MILELDSRMKLRKCQRQVKYAQRKGQTQRRRLSLSAKNFSILHRWEYCQAGRPRNTSSRLDHSLSEWGKEEEKKVCFMMEANHDLKEEGINHVVHAWKHGNAHENMDEGTFVSRTATRGLNMRLSESGVVFFTVREFRIINSGVEKGNIHWKKLKKYSKHTDPRSNKHFALHKIKALAFPEYWPKTQSPTVGLCGLSSCAAASLSAIMCGRHLHWLNLGEDFSKVFRESGLCAAKQFCKVKDIKSNTKTLKTHLDCKCAICLYKQ